MSIGAPPLWFGAMRCEVHYGSECIAASRFGVCRNGPGNLALPPIAPDEDVISCGKLRRARPRSDLPFVWRRLLTRGAVLAAAAVAAAHMGAEVAAVAPISAAAAAVVVV